MSDSRIDLPVDLAGLIAYQEAAVVSHTLVKEKTGTVTLFAFDAGEGLSEHSAPFDALVMVVDGRCAIALRGEEHTVGAGQVLRLPAGVPHAVAAVERCKMLLVMIRQ